MSKILGRFLRKTDAATAVEYAVVLALILMVTFIAIGLLGNQTGQSLQNSNNSLDTVNFGS